MNFIFSGPNRALHKITPLRPLLSVFKNFKDNYKKIFNNCGPSNTLKKIQTPLSKFMSQKKK
jgi:hypothetical protein